MERTKRKAQDFTGKTIDAHSHIGVSLKAYGRMEYPYAQSVEDLRYRQLSAGVDINVVFPFSPDLHFSLTDLIASGKVKKAELPLSPSPYAVENRLLMREIYDYCPEASAHFIPFVSADPGRAVSEQLAELKGLEEEYPVYGLKIIGVACQTRVTELLSTSQALLDFAEERNIPVLFHTTSTADDEYSNAALVLKVVRLRPGVRFCLAHCILFHRGFLDEASSLPNAWVDTAAMKIQVDLVNDCVKGGMKREDLIDSDYSDYRVVMRDICERYPGMMLWGTDAPAYSYFSKRKQGAGTYRSFAYKGSYEEEVAGLRCLPETLQKQISNHNTVAFLFGKP